MPPLFGHRGVAFDIALTVLRARDVSIQNSNKKENRHAIQ
jgi:hypothetical protein